MRFSFTDPRPGIIWTFNELQFAMGDQFFELHQHTITIEGYASTLTLSDITLEDEGLYICSQFGETERINYYITVNSKNDNGYAVNIFF